ncbi:hypothetical protein [Nocardioides daphniae]|nr:hypothetical protein [Nocardioides daphniae]QCC76526.1 hypothetical protein E2C04_03600 [Nocardioides daphniae]
MTISADTATVARTAVARTAGLLLVAGLALGTLVACGTDEATTEPDDTGAPSPSESQSPTGSPSDGEAAFTEVATFTDTRIKVREAGGATVPLASSADVKAWLAPAKAPASLIHDVQEAVEREPDKNLQGAVLWVGCDAPSDWTVVPVGDSYEVRVSPPKHQTQCLAPMTWLALVAVD